MDNKEAKDRLILLKMSYKIRIEEEDIEALDMGAEALDNQKTGHWIRSKKQFTVGEYLYKCSECGTTWEFGWNYKYCPHCGAKMDGE